MRNGGVRPGRLVAALRGWRRYARDRAAFRAAAGAVGMPWGRELPILTEWGEAAGALGAYFFQDLLVARWVREDAPERHVDVGSRIDGFIGHLAVFREVEVLDIRPQPIAVPNVVFHQLDLMAELPAAWLGCADSVSCLHTIEHFGLGRYGDALDPAGHLKGLAQLKRMVRPGGRLYLSTPVGRERVEFNAHRVFSPASVLSWFGDGWSVARSAVVGDRLEIRESGDASALAEADCETGTGMICVTRE